MIVGPSHRGMHMVSGFGHDMSHINRKITALYYRPGVIGKQLKPGSLFSSPAINREPGYEAEEVETGHLTN